VRFRTKGLSITGKRGAMGTGRPQYLLFLKKWKDGRYEAVSGQIDPSLSVREMHHPGLADHLESIHGK
jgi:hypothetical protein